jgi:hypothetical protein
MDLNPHSRNKAPQILIKKSSTKDKGEPPNDDDYTQEEEEGKKKVGGLLNQAIAARSSMKSRENQSLLDSQPSGPLTLPPIGRNSGIKPPSSNISGKA